MRILWVAMASLSLLAGSGCSRDARVGLDNVASAQDVFAGKRVGIITNHTAYDSRGRFIVDVFRQMDSVEVTALFGPEHGFAGTAEAGEKVGDSQGSYGIPIYSLYGKTRKPTPEMLTDVDVLVFDLQDIGSRYYTFTYTMAYAMEAAAEQGKVFVVLDRPNPINAVDVEGNVLDPEFASFVGLYPIATRHGMTIGELAKMFNGQGWLKGQAKAQLVVVPMTGYKRAYWYDETGLAFINPSPNMRSVEAAAVYPGMCLFEGTNVSEGRGTEEPFLVFGAPWIEAAKLTAALNGLALPGMKFEPTEFTPTASKHEGHKCFGCRIVITDRDTLEPFAAGVAMVATINRMYPEDFEWRTAHFDRLCGTDAIRKTIEAGGSWKDLKEGWGQEIKAFREIRQTYLLY